MSRPPDPVLTLPHDAALERELVGSILVRAEAMDEVVPILPTPSAFCHAGCGKVYETALRLYRDGQPVTLVSVGHALHAGGGIVDLGPTAGLAHDFLAGLARDAATPWHAAYFARKVKALETARSMIFLGRQMAEDAQKLAGEPDELRADYERRLFELGEAATHDQPKGNAEVMSRVYDRLEAYEKGERVGIDTGFVDLDAVLNGLRDGELIVLAGRPGMGKSKLAGNVVVNIAKAGVPAALFNLEMSNEEVAERFACAESRVDHFALRNGKVDGDARRRVAVAVGQLRELPIFWHDRPSLRPSELLSHLRRLKRKHGIGLAVVDHLLLMGNDQRHHSQNDRIGEISRMLKLTAKEVRLPVIALCQMNRGIDSRHDDMPRLSDLRDSGNIEQDADTVLFLHKKRGEQGASVQLVVAKQRNGPTTILHLYDDAKSYRFSNYAGE